MSKAEKYTWGTLLVLLCMSAIGLLYLASATAKARQVWSTAGAQYAPKISQLKKQISDLENGTDKASVPALGVALYEWTVDLGQTWDQCTITQVDPATGGISVDVNSLYTAAQVSAQITPNMILFVFVTPPQGLGVYLGEYKVTFVGNNNNVGSLALAPTMNFLASELQAIPTLQGATVKLYEIMPIDRHEPFMGMDQAALEQILPGLPPNVLNEYLRHGKDPLPDDPPERIDSSNKYDRQLRDYALLFRDLHRQISQLKDVILAAANDGKFVKDALDSARAQQAARDMEIAALNQELNETTGERDLAKAHHDALAERVSSLTAQLDQLLEDNKNMSASLTDFQLQVLRQADALSNAAN